MTALANPINTDLIGEAMINNTILDELREINFTLISLKLITKNSDVPCSTISPHIGKVEDRLNSCIALCESEPVKAEVVKLKVVRK